jgi:hypothetical protein
MLDSFEEWTMEFKMPQLPEKTKPFLLGAAAGALLLAWAGFDMLGWKTAGGADTLAKKQADSAIVAALAPICDAHFRGGPNFSVRLTALQKTDRWSRGEMLVKGGWATMDGSKEPTSGVAEACAELLVPEKM